MADGATLTTNAWKSPPSSPNPHQLSCSQQLTGKGNDSQTPGCRWDKVVMFVVQNSPREQIEASPGKAQLSHFCCLAPYCFHLSSTDCLPKKFCFSDLGAREPEKGGCVPFVPFVIMHTLCAVRSDVFLAVKHSFSGRRFGSYTENSFTVWIFIRRIVDR